MVSVESTAGRRIIGRLDKGSDVGRGLLELCAKHKVRTSTFTALGALDELEICEYDQRNRVYKPSKKFAGVFEVLNLTGNVSDKDGKPFVHAHITVSRERDNGIEVLGGHLLSSRIFALEVVMNVFDDVVLKRTMDQATGLTLWSEGVEFEPEPRDVKAVGWQDVVAASATAAAVAPAAVAPPVTDDTPVHLESGDIIEHPKFGRCQVLRVEGDQEFAQVRLGNQRSVRLSLDVLTFTRVGKEGSIHVYKARLGDA